MNYNKPILVKQYFLLNSSNFNGVSKFAINERIEESAWDNTTAITESPKDKLIKHHTCGYNLKIKYVIFSRKLMKITIKQNKVSFIHN